MINASEKILSYFDKLEKDLRTAYDIAENARSKNLDPFNHVEILLAENMSERVEGLISTVAPQIKGSGISQRLQELEEKYNAGNLKIGMIIALEVAQEKFCKFKDKKEAIEVGLRVGLAYLTNGVVASPLEGFTKLELKNRKDNNKEYFCLYFSGPIRSAGTTATCVFVAVSDYVRKKLGYAEYDPTEDEIKRQVRELYDFHERVTNLQYLPSEEELDFMVRNLPVQINGDPSEKIEVSNYKDLDRVETNVLRNGVCLVLGEGLTQKAAKFWGRFSKDAKEMEMESWDFLEKFIKIQKNLRAKGKLKSDEKISPDFNYIKDLVAGRPVLGYPLTKGGFRLRYGRTRINGFSATSLHPATMEVLNGYIASGTQLKVERPGKATVITPCDSIEGPIVKLNDGSVVLLRSQEEAKKYLNQIEEILFLGDILINYGDFFNRAHKLVKPGYCEEWWFLEFEKAIQKKGIIELGELLGIDIEVIKNLFKGNLDIKARDAVIISKKLKIPLHPRYTYHWNDINIEEFKSLLNWIKYTDIIIVNNEIEKIIFPLNMEFDLGKPDPKRVLELLGVPHLVVLKESVVIEKDDAVAFAASLNLESKKNFDEFKFDKENVLEIVNKISEMKIKDKSGVFIGSRMGRPEKAKMRKLTGSPHVLFPVGDEGGRLRCFQAAMELGKIKGDFPIYICECGNKSIFPVCELCGKSTKRNYYCYGCGKEIDDKECLKHGKSLLYKKQEIDIRKLFENSLKKLKLTNYPDLIKGVRGTSNEDHFPENLSKGILRAMEDVYVNKDGTIRYDMTELGITHFKPKEIGTNVEKLKELGYVKDVNGNELTNDDQIIEIFPQDVILPEDGFGLEEGADEILFRISKFVDNLLIRFYGLDSFYNLKNKDEARGLLLLGLSPHTSAGVLCRVIGFSKLQGFVAHPLLHSIMRRDCDGDESCVVLLMDALLNFSRKLLPGHRGARQDAPLVLTIKLIPKEVDDMVFDMDVVWKYPLEFYEAAEEWKEPWDIKLEQLKDRLDTEKQYEGIGFTHSISDINLGVTCSAYKKLPTMQEKVYGQMELANKIRAVDENDVARLVIERHFIRDIKGNLRKFSQQQFRCVKCNEKYRRPPLIGQCTKCGGRIIFTIAEGTIIKYMEPALSLADKYDIPVYLKQTLNLTQNMIESVFGKDPEKQEGLGRWF